MASGVSGASSASREWTHWDTPAASRLSSRSSRLPEPPPMYRRRRAGVDGADLVPRLELGAGHRSDHRVLAPQQFDDGNAPPGASGPARGWPAGSSTSDHIRASSPR
ncbi:hypothetical protein [Streptomyces sp. WZ.A104]|uniref:hypothetical protein n=1 Tax=Streptomyces sp. WZ.A104 TaxID=2023771 RepID=UPI0011807C14|nr:hypothetical protein [Streptomyces sp. WZ.A104]